MIYIANVEENLVVFSNIAVVSYPFHYGPIQQKHDLSIYVLKESHEPKLIPNPNDQNVPEVISLFPKEIPLARKYMKVGCHEYS